MKKDTRKIVFIIGQGGVGKTTLVNYFRKHPVENWLFFDFDKGIKVKPHTKDLSKLKPWVDKQRQYWLKEVYSKKYGDKNIVLFGVGLFPWKVGFPKDISFAYLNCNQKSRKERLIERGDPHIWYAYQKDVQEIVKRLDGYGAKCFETGSCSVEETAKAIRGWLRAL